MQQCAASSVQVSKVRKRALLPPELPCKRFEDMTPEERKQASAKVMSLPCTVVTASDGSLDVLHLRCRCSRSCQMNNQASTCHLMYTQCHALRVIFVHGIDKAACVLFRHIHALMPVEHLQPTALRCTPPCAGRQRSQAACCHRKEACGPLRAGRCVQPGCVCHAAAQL